MNSFEFWCDVYNNNLQSLYRIFQDNSWNLLPISKYKYEDFNNFVLFCNIIYEQSTGKINKLDIDYFVDESIVQDNFNPNLFNWDRYKSSDIVQFKDDIIFDIREEMEEYIDRYALTNILTRWDNNIWLEYIDELNTHYSRE